MKIESKKKCHVDWLKYRDTTWTWEEKMERGRKLWGMKDKIYSVELKHLPLSGADYMKIIAILYIYFPLMKSSPSVTVKVEVVCEVGPGRALRDKLRWYMTHGDSIKTLDPRHLEKWRSPMLGSCDIYKIKLFFFLISGHISAVFLPSQFCLFPSPH